MSVTGRCQFLYPGHAGVKACFINWYTQERQASQTLISIMPPVAKSSFPAGLHARQQSLRVPLFRLAARYHPN